MRDWLFIYAPVVALAISVFAAVLSAFSLGWNIYRDLVMKPKLRVTFGVRSIFPAGGRASQRLLMISAANFGPGQLTCSIPTIKQTSLWKRLTRRTKRAVVVHEYTHPLCSTLPRRLEMAEEMSLVFPYAADCFLALRPTHVGLIDSFGRVHWARRSDVRGALRCFESEFPNGSPDGRPMPKWW